MRHALLLQYLLGFVLMVLFSYMNAHYPDKTWLFFTLYLLVFMGIIFFVTGRQAQNIFRDLEEVKKGEIIYQADPDQSLKLREKDMEKTQGELAAQFKVSLIPMLTMILFLMVFYIPSFRQFFQNIGNTLTQDQKMAMFYSFLAMYGSFYLISMITGLYTRRVQSKTGTLTIATKYTITSRGIIVDDRLPIKFPLKGSIGTDNKRKFVEITLIQQVMGSQVKQRIRLYTPEPSKLANLLKEKGMMQK
ncbi:MAG: DUF2208 domain-containing protein [Infirmifilum sp.]|jgi:uncharacterized membrane protein|uniref:DUF2208 domain-containing protein n=1 Tax=Infirmifilum uzonense TaxID=1550241 RepID=A0A0F7FIU4_9CREN|nr:DUF2208 domain-containing protein [Infirmifilum uzonense]AKG38763.1 hypothetical protein MA03_05035 [Infirmifilum uzonense]